VHKTPKTLEEKSRRNIAKAYTKTTKASNKKIGAKTFVVTHHREQ
jgi:hypothetical protein